MILLLNTITDVAQRKLFSEKVFPRELGDCYGERVLGIDKINPDEWKGLIITGSELSAGTGSPLDRIFFDILKGFIVAQKPVLGICWGHQMIARYLGGDDYVRRAPVPEFGWRRIKLFTDDPLFAALEKPILAQSHFDEVCKLKDNWKLLASTEECPNQAIRYGDGPIWGVQFHPEAFFELGTAMFAKVLREYPETSKYHRDDLVEMAHLRQNRLIFVNFTRLVEGA